ncbi:MAG: DUF4394 domain-containing protein [Thermoanaerobaculia bacterium]|nr:MAG: DUF4394 domain-containing protein [Thermoanaerobaculia bacterium]MBZ0101229.1 DUF4394 domain-containing protein [Thermoanaerobaculia bacterium]
MHQTALRTSVVAVSLLLAGAMGAAAAEGFCAGAADSVLAEPAGSTRCLRGANPLDRAPLTAAPLGPALSWIVDLRATPDQVSTAPVGTLTLTPVGPVAAGVNLYATDFDNRARTLYAIDNFGATLGTIDLATGAYVSDGALTGIPAGHTVTGLKFDPLDSDKAFVVTTSGTVSQLHRLDPVARTLTLVGEITGSALAIDLAIANDGTIYVHDIGIDSILTVDRTAGAGTLVGPTGVNTNFAQGMDFDAAAGTLYAWMYLGGGVNNLSTIDLTTGAASLVVNGNNTEIEGSIQVPVPFIFLDGFESGDTGRWSAAVAL